MKLLKIMVKTKRHKEPSQNNLEEIHSQWDRDSKHELKRLKQETGSWRQRKRHGGKFNLNQINIYFILSDPFPNKNK